MRKTILIERCLFCEKEFETIDKKKKFCNNSCAAKYNNRIRKFKQSSKEKISLSLKKYYDDNPKKIYSEYFWNGVKTSKGKFLKNPHSIWDVSKRTRTKILQRLEISCSHCGWNKCVCDLHHINGRKIKDCNSHKNLSYLCPNCHRMAHNNIIIPSELITLEEQIGDKWKECYYG